MNRSEIMAITSPAKLFKGGPDLAKKKYRELSRLWHPDVLGGSTEVFQHIHRLYEAAVKADDWGVFYYSGKGFSGSIDYLSRQVFELGEFFVGSDSVLYLVKEEYKDLYRQAENRRFFYKGPEMEKQVSRYLPIHKDHFQLTDGRFAVRIRKTPDLLLLRDVLDHYKGDIDPKHVAWILSSLYNLACYFSVSEFTHNDISPDTYFISPKHHSGALLGGWWYAAGRGVKLKQIPKRTFKLLPWEVQTKKTASTLTDLELIRATGRELTKDAPKAMSQWFKGVSTQGAVEEYRGWMKVLEADFGKRTFTNMDLNADTLYG